MSATGSPGGQLGKPLPSLTMFRVGKHTKGDAAGTKKERPSIRVVPKSAFARVDSVADLVELLFGV